MAEKKIIELEVKNNLGSLKSQLREAQAEVAKLSEQFGATSREAANAAKRAAELKDQIEDAKALTEAFNPDAKFKALSSSLGGVASGFAAYQGALGLVGVESKKVEEQLLKVQSAMALAEGINGVTSSIESFKNLGSVIKNNVVSAFGSLRAALISTGIGALAVILGAIIANWKEFSKAITDTFPGFSKVTNFFKNFSQVASGTINSVVAGFKTIGQVLGNIFNGDFSKAYDNAKKLGENMAKAYNQGYEKKDKELRTKQSIDNQKFEIDLMKAKGKNTLNAQLELQRKELSLLEKGSDEYKAKLIEIEESKTAIREKAEQEREARVAKAKELAEKRAQELQKKKDEFARKQAQDLEDSEKMKLKTLSLGDPAKEARIKGDKEIREAYKTGLEKQKIDEENAEREKKLAEDVKNKKIEMGQQAFGALGDLATLFADGNEAEQRKAFQISKAANLGLAIMNTANAVTGALAEPSIIPGERFFKAALAGATGGINIARIAATQFQGTGGGDTATASTPTATAPRTPSFDIIQAQPQMQLGSLQQQPVKAYVVSGEVSTAQALDRNRVRNATF